MCQGQRKMNLLSISNPYRASKKRSFPLISALLKLLTLVGECKSQYPKSYSLLFRFDSQGVLVSLRAPCLFSFPVQSKGMSYTTELENSQEISLLPKRLPSCEFRMSEFTGDPCCHLIHRNSCSAN